MKVKEIEVSVTHEIKINGDKTWVGVRMTGSVWEDETTEDAHAQLSKKVQKAVMDEVRATVTTVEEYTK